MNPDQTSLEAELRGLLSQPLDEDFLHRLESCADGTWTSLTPEEARLEGILRKTSPAKLDAGFLAELEKVVQGVPFAVDEKIVLFPKGNQVVPKEREGARRPMWAAAAAVALIGGVSALLVPVSRTGGGTTIAKNPPVTASPPRPGDVSPALPTNYAPASFNSGVSELHDEGTVWKANRPHSLMRVIYKDKVTTTDKDGRTYQMESPREGYILVPAQTD